MTNHLMRRQKGNYIILHIGGASRTAATSKMEDSVQSLKYKISTN